MDNKVGTDGPTGLPAAQEVDLHKLLRVADFVLRKIVDATDIDPASTKFDFKVDGKTFFAASLATFQKQIRAGIEAPQAAAPGGVAPTPSPDLAELREALERDDDDRTTADWNLIDRWARGACDYSKPRRMAHRPFANCRRTQGL